ncbi:hypothetical protein GALMADRAFT_146052 [Galerina marginata CBS 339.88]|uniref:P-loop containing nucleoside triphosphate hydrolase protein n=1 Tax=Galerina marginata (strain CBS 339.88) TaxID=685588 RepID=A0A067SLV4_GALM3|nr:hypothetical protein GALMADRAFT_146052 [Galerina marginata CBS 339.88]
MPVTMRFLNEIQAESSRLFALTLFKLGIDSWNNTVIIPLASTFISGGLLLLQSTLHFSPKHNRCGNSKRIVPLPASDDACSTDLDSTAAQYADSQGCSTIFAFKVARLVGCSILFSLSLVKLVTGKESRSSETAIVITYCYTAFLSGAALANSTWSQLLTRHTNVILLTSFGVYFYRDVWPLATYTQVPQDQSDGPFLWVKIVVLTFTAVVIPLFVPRQYYPVDPKDAMQVPNREQTASLFRLMVYSFLDPVVFEAYRVPHLPYNRLPVLADKDYSKNLTAAAFPYLDPFLTSREMHLFFGLLKVFFWEYLGMTIALVVQVFASFAPPVALNRILASLESEGYSDYIRPWFWVACLFFGPLMESISRQGYIYLGTMALARIQAILTELIFEHSLRIRSNGGTSGHTSKTSEVGCSDSEDSESRSTETEVTTSSKVHSATTHTLPTENAKKDRLAGKINTLITVDLDNILYSKDFLMLIVQIPLELALAMVFLYAILGWSAIVGFASIVLLLPAPGYLASRMQVIQGKKMERTDARVELITETIGVLRMIKLFGWEKKTSDAIRDKRDEELEWIWKDKMTNLLNGVINFIIPIITMLVTYATYTMVMKKSLNASKVFSSIAVFDVVANLLHTTSSMFNMCLKGKVSLERVAGFLGESELLDCFSVDPMSEPASVNEGQYNGITGFNNATFSWSNDMEDEQALSSPRSFRLRIDGMLAFKRGCINLIIGPTDASFRGSGKTSVLMALLGEMHFIRSSNDSWYNLPREGGVAYAAQESWVQNETIRNNILFGSPFEEGRYNKVIHQCALTRDIELFEAGDQTEVGENGLTLSGGQKARITLARAVYSSADIILLDDVLASLDVHTSKWVIDKCLKGDLIYGRTLLLVTHNVTLARPIAHHIVSIGPDGIVHEVGSDISMALAHDPVLAREIEQEEEAAKTEKDVVDDVAEEDLKHHGKLIMVEEILEGHVSWRSLMLFLKAIGGDRPFLFWAVWMISLALMQGGMVFSVWFLGYWGSQYENHQPEDVRVVKYLSLFSLIHLATVAIFVMAATLYNYGTVRASRRINSLLINSILGSTLRWLDETPASRIITRCTQDIASIDGALTAYFGLVVEMTISGLIKLAGPVIYSPVFLLPGILVSALGVYLGNIYLKAQMSVKREMSNARSPVLAHFGAATAGLVSIRAYGAQEFFKAESLIRIDHYTRISRTSYNLNRWIAIRVDMLGASFTTALASYLLTRRTLSTVKIGFSLNMSVEFCTMILSLVRYYNDLEVQANSLERIQSYLEIEHEPKTTKAGKPPAAWPRSGDLRVEGLFARYSATGPEVLRDLSFHVKSGERIGIVGRTGSGKTSLTLSLLRCILTDGGVYYDGIPTNQINLDDLRSNITLIPQMPELLTGTLRRNLDPFEQHDDVALNDVLHAAGLFSLQLETDVARLTLDSELSSRGANISVGQRQIIALARAILRNNKLLIMDEATSAIDHQTDSTIQSSLRSQLGSDVTVLTIAHRLQNIMDSSKIMVLDDGRLVEFDSPQNLLRMKGGYFWSLVNGSEGHEVTVESSLALQ